LFCAALFLVGCNAFGTGDTSGGDTVEELVADADVAIRKGNYDSAVASLEQAYDEAPSNAEVRVKLATALYGQSDLNVLDMKSLSDYVTGLEGDATTASARTKAHDGVDLQCSVQAAEPTPENQGYVSIDLKENDTFATILAVESMLKRVNSALLTEAFRRKAYDRLAPDLKASWLTNAAFADLTLAVLTVYNEAQARGGHLFREREGSGVVFCAPEKTDLDALECEAYRVAEQEDLIGQTSLLARALAYLKEKNELFGSGSNSTIPDALANLIDAVTSNIDQQDRERCTSSARTRALR
jgi:hypothetical protein